MPTPDPSIPKDTAAAGPPGPIAFDLRWVRGAGPDGIGRYATELFRALHLSGAGAAPPPIGLYSDPA
ncbi:MAG: hypothetical protein ABIK65_15010, partial [Candidatus Eisenbacteria bacterium]